MWSLKRIQAKKWKLPFWFRETFFWEDNLAIHNYPYLSQFWQGSRVVPSAAQGRVPPAACEVPRYTQPGAPFLVAATASTQVRVFGLGVSQHKLRLWPIRVAGVPGSRTPQGDDWLVKLEAVNNAKWPGTLETG